MEAVIPATPDVTLACDALDNVITRFLDARGTLPHIGEFESHVEAMNLFYLAIRNVEGTVELARRDLVLAPAGMVLARAALETAVKAAWMVNADDPFEREVRWLAHLAEEERFHQRVASRLSKAGASGEASERTAAIIRTFREQVTERLPAHVAPRHRNPTIDDMLTDLGARGLNLAYINLSQFTHGSHVATSTYRRNLGAMKQFGEFVSPSSWFQPLSVCWLSLSGPGRLVLLRLGGNPEAFLTEQDVLRFKGHVDAIGSPAVH
jgi:hypothetical protein